MQCPTCGGDTWDNAQKVAEGWKGPLRKCKDKECSWVLWPPKNKGAAPGKSFEPRAPKWTWGTLSVTYSRSLLLAAKHVKALDPKAPLEAIVAAAATIFIAASRDGVGEKKVAPPAAPPPPTREELATVPAQLEEPDDDLPF